VGPFRADPDRQRRLEDAYAEVVNARPYLSRHIPCGRKADGSFQWELPFEPAKSSSVTNGGLRIFHSVKRQAIPIGFDQRPLGPIVGNWHQAPLGWLVDLMPGIEGGADPGLRSQKFGAAPRLRSGTPCMLHPPRQSINDRMASRYVQCSLLLQQLETARQIRTLSVWANRTFRWQRADPEPRALADIARPG